jgi:RNA-directed DNA polymerase
VALLPPLVDEGPNGQEGKSLMGLDDKLPQMPAPAGLATGSRGEAPRARRSEETSSAAREKDGSGLRLAMEAVVERGNLLEALKRVKRNKGSAGVDGMTTEELAPYLQLHWPRLREELLAGRYQPQPVRRVSIPKDGGGMRELGIPTVVDRFIQQALLQVLQPVFDRTFSQHSYGFRPGRSAHGAVRAAQRFVQEGRRVVVDVDLEKFFDRVNHDVLMDRLAKRLDDKRILRVVRRYLEAGVMMNGVVVERRYEGTPQGGPLSPLLANVLLDEVDKELERRGHLFARYADDANIYVRSRRAGERVMALLRDLYGALHLRINEEKSAVASAFSRKFLGYSMWVAPKGVVKLRVAAKAMAKMKDRVRALTRRVRGQSLRQIAERLRSYLVGWKNYFRLAETPRVFRDVDKWLRHRMRAVQLKHWKRGTTAYPELRKLGLNEDGAAQVAGNMRRWWHNSKMLLNAAMPVRFFDELGVPRLG